VELRRPGQASLLKTNVVLPMDQTVVLGSAYPGIGGDALILTVRGEMGATELRTSSRRSHDDSHANIEADAYAASAALLHDLEVRREQAALANALGESASQIEALTTGMAESIETRIVVPATPSARTTLPSVTTTVAPARKRTDAGARPPGGER